MMTGGDFDVAGIVLAFLLNYAVLSTITLGLSWFVCRLDCMGAAVSRLRAWKLALLLPIPLTAAAMLVPAPWLPVVRIEQTVVSVQAADPIARNNRTMTTTGLQSKDFNPRFDAPRQRDGSTRSDSGIVQRRRGDRDSVSPTWFRPIAVSILVIWPAGVLVGMICLIRDLWQLSRVIRSGRSVNDGPLRHQFSALRERMQLTDSIDLLESPRVSSPLAAGCWSSRILLPSDWMAQLSPPCREAVLAHELSHISRRDAAWNLLIQIARRAFWFQPLNVLACRQIRRDMEFVADQQAARFIDDPSDLVRSLVQLAERLSNATERGSAVPSLAAGMSVHASGLKARVSAVLSLQSRSSKPMSGAKIAGVAGVVCIVLLMGVPRFGLPVSPHVLGESPGMFDALKRIGLMAGVVATTIVSPADDVVGQEKMKRSDGTATRTKAGSKLPEGLQQFSGMLIGKMMDRDIERGSFTVKVDYVARVWENNKARKPRSIVGQQVTVNGVTGKWLDELLLVRPGETVEFEAQHRGGDELIFPGEWLKKVPAFDAAEHPVPPEGFRGFAGMVTGRIIKKNQSSRELHLRIESIEDSFEKNRAKSAEEVIGKEIVLAGFWARMSKPFDNLEKDDRIRAGVLHRVPQSDHFTVIETAEKIGKSDKSTRGNSKASVSSKGFPAGMEGFRGILRGTLVRKDVEKGTLVFEADRVTRTWKANRASDTGSCRGHQFLVEGISGKWIDVLITMQPGDKIEVEAFHNSGEHLDFISEWLKKVE